MADDDDRAFVRALFGDDDEPDAWGSRSRPELPEPVEPSRPKNHVPGEGKDSRPRSHVSADMRGFVNALFNNQD